MRFTALLLALMLSLSSFSQDYYLFIGTYTNGKSKGIYVYDFNAATGTGKPGERNPDQKILLTSPLPPVAILFMP